MIELYNADFREVLPKIKAKYAMRKIIIVSDPPFNIGYKYGKHKDNVSESEYKQMIIDAFGGTRPCVIIHYPEVLHKITSWINKFPSKIVSWVYNSNTAKQHRDIAFYGIEPNFRRITQPYKNPNDKRIKKLIENGSRGGRLYDWWNINQVKNVSKEKSSHPCQMPIEVMKNIIGILPNDVLIIDPFSGSGTTGIACKELNRDFIGIEIDNEYYEIMQKRIIT